MKWKLMMVALLASCSLFVPTKDCSVYDKNSPALCKCIRDNGDEERALECNRRMTQEALEKKKKECLQRCWGDHCNEECSKI